MSFPGKENDLIRFPELMRQHSGDATPFQERGGEQARQATYAGRSYVSSVTTPVTTPQKDSEGRSIPPTPESFGKLCYALQIIDLGDSKGAAAACSPLRRKVADIRDEGTQRKRQRRAVNSFRQLVFKNPALPTLEERQACHSLVVSSDSMEKFAAQVISPVSIGPIGFDLEHLKKPLIKAKKRTDKLTKQNFEVHGIAGGHMVDRQYYQCVFKLPNGFSIGKVTLPVSSPSLTGKAVSRIKSQFPHGKNEEYLNKIFHSASNPSKVMGRGERAIFCEINAENKKTGLIAVAIQNATIHTAFPLFIIGRADKGPLEIENESGEKITLKSDILQRTERECKREFGIKLDGEELEVIDIAAFFKSNKGTFKQGDIPKEFDEITESVFALRPSQKLRDERERARIKAEKARQIEERKAIAAAKARQKLLEPKEESDEFEGFGGLEGF